GGALAYGSGTPTAPTNPNALLAAAGGVDAASPDAPQWQVAGVGDFNGDGLADALLLRGDGLLAAGTINGDPATILGQLEPGWSIAGIGDIDNDGTSDILLQNDDGSYQADLIQDNAIVASVDMVLVDGQWQVVTPPDTPPSGEPGQTPAVAPG